MDYSSAAKIRKKSFGTLLAELEGGLGSSLKSAIGQKTRANIEGLKETFDPMNIAKKMTFGSNWAPAMLGKLTGRKAESIAHFTGARLKNKTMGRSAAVNDNDDGEDAPTPAIESVRAIHKLIKDREKEVKKWNKNDDKFDKKDKKEEERRHKELLKALSLKRVTPSKPTKPTEKPGGQPSEKQKPPPKPTKPTQKPTPTKKTEQPPKKTEQPAKKEQPPAKKTEQPAKKEQPPAKKEEQPVKKEQPPAKKEEQPAQRQQERDSKNQENKSQTDKKQADKDTKAKEKADKDRAEKDRVAKEKADKEAKQKADREAKDAKEKADKENKAAKDKADREAKDAKEKADKEAKDARDKTDRETATRQKKEEQPAQQPQQQAPAQTAPRQQPQRPGQQKEPSAQPAKPSTTKPSTATKVGREGEGLKGLDAAQRSANIKKELVSMGASSALSASVMLVAAKETQAGQTLSEEGPVAYKNTWRNMESGKSKIPNDKYEKIKAKNADAPQSGAGAGTAYMNFTFGKKWSSEQWKSVIDDPNEGKFFEAVGYKGGEKYKGRSLIGITHKDTYEAIGKLMGLDLVNNPELINKDVKTTSAATLAYLSLLAADSLSPLLTVEQLKAGYQKGLKILNSYENPEDLKKALILLTAGKGKVNIADVEQVRKAFSSGTDRATYLNTQLHEGEKMYNVLGLSQENTQLRGELNNQGGNSTTVNNTTVNNQTLPARPGQRRDDSSPMDAAQRR
jgi:hypothetical protein